MFNGIINIYKEKGYTSHDVVAKMRGILRIKKIGHTGTLDPDAEGVLPICIGKATKVVDLIVEKDKSYEAILKLGFVTDTQDMTGSILRTYKVDTDLSRIKAAADSFIGGYNQIPPMYSALKVNGRKLYELARQGKEIERKPRRVDIHDIQILEYNHIDEEVSLRVDCGKGTYIRTLLYDMGQILGCGGAMKSLVRTRVGGFLLSDSLKLHEVEDCVQQGTIDNYVTLADDMFPSYPRVIVKDEYNKLIYNGNSFMEKHLVDAHDDMIESAISDHEDMKEYKILGHGDIIDSTISDHEDVSIYVRVYDSKGIFIGIYRYDKIDKRFHVRKMFL